MKKIFYSLLVAGCGLWAVGARAAAPEYATQGNNTTSRVGMAVNRVGAIGRPTIPVTTTTTTNTFVPETNITSETSETVNVDIDGAKAACLMTAGNVWANKMFANIDGTPATYEMTPAATPEDNVCFSLVSVKSSEIKNMARFFPPRYFKTGDAIECGRWLDEAALDEAILDAKKSSRVAGTIAASVGGAVIGVGLTEFLGRKFITGFEGQKDYEVREMIKTLSETQPAAMKRYQTSLAALKAACDGSATDKPEECADIDYNTILADINEYLKG